MEKTMKRYTISANIAAQKGIPRCFVAAELARTPKGAIYLYGHGTTDPEGRCCRCGRLLTHPGSILIGIGPECLGDWGVRDAIKENMTEEDIARLKALVFEKKVDCWIPMYSIRDEEDVGETIAVPDDHKLLLGKNGHPTNGDPKKTATLDPTGKFAVIKFQYDPETINNVKTLEGRRWDPNSKTWSAWASQPNLQKLFDWGFALDDGLKALLIPTQEKQAKGVEQLEKDIAIEGLYRFQAEGVRFLEQRNGNALIADSMGLGKTIQALAWLKIHPELRPVVVVCPASIKLNWERETLKWLKDKRVAVLSGTKPALLSLRMINIINYDILPSWMPVLLEAEVKVVIVDESHYCKNTKALRTKAVQELCAAVPHKIFLTGTPVVNRPAEFFTTLKILDPINFSSWIRFAQRYCDAYQDRFGWNCSGASNTAELHERLTKTIMIRRKKEDVLKDLPSKRRCVIPMEIKNRKEYGYAEEELLSWIREKFGKGKAESAAQAEALAKFSYLKQLAAEGKLESTLGWVHDCLETNGKLVVFAVHHKVIDTLAQELRMYNPVVLDGRTPVDKRQALVDKFQNDPTCKVFIGNIKAAGVGITLTASSNVVFVELPWTPGDVEQASDRCHRIGQENEVTVWFLVSNNTIEEELAGIIDSKLVVLNKVLDGQDTEAGSLLSELLRKRLEG